MLRTSFAAGTVLAAAMLTACSGERGLACESGERYETAVSVAPIRVPDDLSLPDETEALRVPFPSSGNDAPPEGECLESPPDFFEEGVGAPG
ncbi:MAG: hypothetical protein JXB36_20690 [Gammaproteobacteria bacterium]|nr:hypothetical protein [Gammaproteobacteria bacterium]